MTSQQQERVHNCCPSWCDGEPGHEISDGSHSSEYRRVLVQWQQAAAMLVPDVLVTARQVVDSTHSAHAPVISLTSGIDQHFTPDQARELIVAIADQLASIEDMGRAVSVEWHCPWWCTVDPAEHAEETGKLYDEPGGAAHQSEPWRADPLQVQAITWTDPSGLVDADAADGVQLGDLPMTPGQARHVALELLRAAALVEVAGGR